MASPPRLSYPSLDCRCCSPAVQSLPATRMKRGRLSLSRLGLARQTRRESGCGYISRRGQLFTLNTCRIWPGRPTGKAGRPLWSGSLDAAPILSGWGLRCLQRLAARPGLRGPAAGGAARGRDHCSGAPLSVQMARSPLPQWGGGAFTEMLMGKPRLALEVQPRAGRRADLAGEALPFHGQ